MLKITKECSINEHVFPRLDVSSRCLKCQSINVVNNQINLIDNYEVIKKWGRYDGRHTAGLVKVNKEILFFIHFDDSKHIWDSSIEDFTFALPYHLYEVYKVDSEEYEKFFEGRLYFYQIQNKEFIGYIADQLDEIFLKEWYCYYDWVLTRQSNDKNVYIWDYDEFKLYIKWYQNEELFKEDFQRFKEKSKVMIDFDD